MNRRAFFQQFLALPVIVGPLPNNIVDGTLADAGPVMANYNWILTQVNANAMPLTGPFYGGGFQDPGLSNSAYGSGALAANASGTFNSAFGNTALSALTQSNGNTAVGAQALQHFNGAPFINTNNVAVGYNAALTLTTATDCIAVGANALLNDSSGSQNICIGSSAGAAIVSGTNLAIGYQAMQNFTGGATAIAIGYQAMQNAVTGGGANCVAIGNGAMATSAALAAQCIAIGTNTLPAANSVGNIAIGNNAGQGVTTGGGNVCIGSGSGPNVGSGVSNVAVGNSTLIGSSVSRVTAVGQTAAGASGGANDVTALGYQAAQNALAPGGAGMTAVGSGALSTGSNVPNTTAVGFNAGTALNNANGNCTLVGYQAGVTLFNGFNNVAVGNSALGAAATSNSVAIGPFALQTGGGSNEIAIGVSALQNATGNSNVAIGYQAGFAGTAIITGDHNTFLGDSAQSNGNGYTNGMALGNAAILTASNTIVLGNSSIGFLRCQVTTINTLSDRRDKHDVEDLTLGADFMKQLKPVSYRLSSSPAVKRYGFIAQEVQQALLMLTPDAQLTERTIGDGKGNLALLMRENDEKGTYLLGYNELIAPMVRAIQELTARIQLLEKNAA